MLRKQFCLSTYVSKGPRKRGNIVAETLLRKHCFLAAQTGKHLLKKQNVSEKKSETFFVSRKLKNVSATNVSCPRKRENI